MARDKIILYIARQQSSWLCGAAEARDQAKMGRPRFMIAREYAHVQAL